MSNERAVIPERALSLTGPWWWLMLHLPEPWRKCVENRKPGFSWKSFRGPLWVYATAERSEEVYAQAVGFARAAGLPETLLEKMPTLAEMPCGGIVGQLTITKRLAIPGFDLLDEEIPMAVERWRMPNRFGFLTTEPKLVPFTPCRGAQGFWRVPHDLLRKLAEAA